MNAKLYALWLFLACLAAALLGFALGGQEDTKPPLRNDYNAYEKSVMEQVNDR